MPHESRAALERALRVERRGESDGVIGGDADPSSPPSYKEATAICDAGDNDGSKTDASPGKSDH